MTAQDDLRDIVKHGRPQSGSLRSASTRAARLVRDRLARRIGVCWSMGRQVAQYELTEAGEQAVREGGQP